MTILPANELRILGVRDNFASIRIMELGNKKNPSGLYRDWYEAQQAAYFCTDINGKDGAFPWDIRESMPDSIKSIAPFDIVTNFGFTEHVQDSQFACWENIHNMVHPALGQLSCVLPAPGYWPTHGVRSGFPGRWYPHPAFFSRFAKDNGYQILDLFFDIKTKTVCCQMVRDPKLQKPFLLTYEFLYDNVQKPDFDGNLIW